MMRKLINLFTISITVLFASLFAVVLLTACGSSSNGKTSFESENGIQFSKIPLKQLIAQKGSKSIFLFAHASYCSSCKEMIKAVLPEKEVGDIFNTHFINAQVDIESEEGRELVRDFEITGTPTLLFLTPGGKLISKVSGFQSNEELLALSKSLSFTGKPVAE